METNSKTETNASATANARVLFWQVVRFGISGVLLTIGVAAAYWAIADLLHVDPNVSLFIVFVIFSAIGYVVHSRYSFKDHGARDKAHIRTLRFFASNTLGLAANQFFVWFLVKYLGGPTWWPIIPMVLVTPFITFTLNRRWVFG